MIIDAHCHGGPGDGFTGPWDTRAQLGRYLVRAGAAGIARTVVFAPFASDYRAANRNTAAIVAAAPDRFFGFACVHPSRDRGRVAALLDEAVRTGLRGIKVHRHDAPVTREVADAAARRRLPVLYDVQGKVETVELLATEFPTVDWIVPHLGSFSDEWWPQRTMIELLVRHPNVYADTAGVRRFDLLKEAAERAPAKLIFGSDGPELHPGLELAKIRALHLAPAVERNVTGGIVARLLRSGPTRNPVVGLKKSLATPSVVTRDHVLKGHH